MGFGILSTIKGLAPLSLYLIGILCFLAGLLGKGRWSLLLVTFLVPLRNIIDRIQAYPVGTHFLDMLILGAMISWFLEAIQHKRQLFAPSSLNFIAVMMVAYTFLTLLLGTHYLTGFFSISLADERVKDWKNFCLMPLLFFVTLNLITDRKWIERMLLAMLIAIVIMDYYTISQIGSFTSLVSREKINGTFVFLGPNEVAAFYNEFTLIMVGIFFYTKQKRTKSILLGLIYAGVYCILFLFSRGAYLGFFVGLAFLFILKNKRFLLPLILVAVFWQAILPEKAIDRIKGTTNEFGQLDESSERRVLIWQQALNLFSQNAITGIGYGVFRNLGLDLGDTHNIYVKILVEQGSIGFIILFVVLFSFLRMGYILYKKGEDDLAKGMGLGLVACMIAVFLNNFFGDRWAYFELSAYLWIFAGLVGRYIILSKTPIQQETPVPIKENKKNIPITSEVKKKKIRYYDL